MGRTSFSSCIEVRAEFRDGGYYVLTSPNLPGLLLCGKDKKKLEKQVPEVIKGLFKLNYGLDVEIRPNIDPSQIKKFAEQKPPKARGWSAVSANAA